MTNIDLGNGKTATVRKSIYNAFLDFKKEGDEKMDWVKVYNEFEKQKPTTDNKSMSNKIEAAFKSLKEQCEEVNRWNLVDKK